MIEIERKLVAYAGVVLEDIFPVDLRAERLSHGGVKFATQIQATREVVVSQLPAGTERQLLTTSVLDGIEGTIDSDLMRTQLETALDSLTLREAKILKMRFGIEDGEEATLDEVATHFQRSPERIRQIEAKALRKLRHRSRARFLKPLLSGEGGWQPPRPSIRLVLPPRRDDERGFELPLQPFEKIAELLAAGWEPLTSGDEALINRVRSTARLPL